MKKVAICSCGGHEDHPAMPLIWTFAFNYKEYWCPYCGNTYGAMGRDRVEKTPELEALLEKYRIHSRHFLRAKGSQVCCEHLILGKWVKQLDIPQWFRDKMSNYIEDYKYGVKL